ncbi:MAG: ATP-dependent Clp protease ATP-binding subunit [Rikenellaceae bacterium]
MKSLVSRSLDGIIARSTFKAIKSQVSHSLPDFLVVEMLMSQSTLAYQLLASHMESWQLYQLTTQLKSAFEVPHPKPMQGSVELFYRTMLERITQSYQHEPRITSIHALHYVANDSNSATSRLLSQYGVTKEFLGAEILRYSMVLKGINLATKHPAIEHKPDDHPLLKFGVDLTAMARVGDIDPVIGREEEIDRVVQILSRRKKNNPILIGEAGVGKSAVVEGLAHRIVAGDVPDTIKSKRLFSLDISALIAGTKFRGEFEERMQRLLEALRESKDSIIFIDEIHTVVGAGATQGSLDAANILKPALARGELQTIGATTLNEYRVDIESDSALERRFQKVMVEPTTDAQTLEILRRISPHYQRHHGVVYSEEALRACVELSSRYLTERYQPDKAIDMLDEVGARLRLSGESDVVSAAMVEGVITSITGIPVERLSVSDIEHLRGLERLLGRRIVGQSNAVRSIANTLRRSRTGLKDDLSPIGVFLFVGPTGVGKTLLAKELSFWLTADKRSMVRVDMSEYNEKHTVSRLIGSPPGYVGYGDGGELTEAVRRQPYSVVLLDEIEKAHPEVLNLMLQLFDEGHLTDGAGRKVDFRNTIIIMTSNCGASMVTKMRSEVGYCTSKAQPPKSQARGYDEALRRSFSPEFLNRIDDIVYFRTLEAADIEKIVDIELSLIEDRASRMGYSIRVTAAARRQLARLGYQREYGARALKRTLISHIEEPMSNLIVDGKLTVGGTIVVEKERSRERVKLKVA